LFVGNLPYTVTEDSLRDYFSQAGVVVSIKIITDKYSGRSKGFGFIEMETEEEANKAKEMLDGKDFEGRALAVKDARPPREDGGAPAPAASEPQEVPAAEAEVEAEPEEVAEPEEEVEEEEKTEEEKPSKE
jgi:RNA recognition motif-containing protein